MSKLKILVTGASGLVGSRFIEKYSDKFNFVTPEYPQFDLTNKEQVSQLLEKENPDWIVNFAAFTDVNASEAQSGDETGPAWQVNVEGTKNLSDSFKSKNFIQISTDMVFPGDLSQPGPYEEPETPPDSSEKLTWYGWTKNRAEKIVRDNGGTILRIIYPVRVKFEPKSDYIRGALKKYADGKMYPLFRDQQICIAFIDEIAEALDRIIETGSHGVFHCSSDTTTPYELITFVIDHLSADSSVIKSISVHEFLKTQTNPNRYPVWGGLKTKITEETLDLHFSSWQTVVELLLGQGLSLPKI
ncbi:MAG: DTDP-4-dehydrorhamnose reductase [Candidatus Collierbacteria bacterium GW2011_GWB1_45_35]|uniref:dTDP-4-dehydrorhamnose reductase n=2 Tax=Candidatus Collieribacteriota TaxID=1752725 RepID=A0A0G1N012_9BACT|nr:MAG: DTDP-4-dehydrorhamnose reductase [Microgenomates group bacterium GW2011_GWC1_44_23]KKT86387.1 MAG: DTDP-4-dehydrorhamnose reductase [Candidatus Collierbacteria bacterium GW2011_GWA2_44_99]KKT95794.1 MAG: DTDP-4-dehydrorhamnose reductase [Candidatus Collierbacteria bacterium GW2011_GWA1_45_15]KKU00262.1 MAG: DTDP-4-dehydrorhamnose reductase [Candidatus Collierbacteria bacterium GW2011_GWB2_45_17]KKU05511.1 MAG: DTDP-4-dehydrorhamnose reductase [Candidatus Collierbacteria bacterium GW2011